MSHLQIVPTVIWLVLACVLVPAHATQVPITSKAELARYLQDTAPGTSPLDELSPGGRKRFLAQLQFGEHGLRSVSLDDPTSELTHPQIVRLLTLFGAEAHATKGLTPAEQARREQERARDAAARGCAVETCAESDVERRYDEFVLHEAAASVPEAQRATLISERYDRLFGDYQAPQRLRRASPVDLRLIRRAAENAVFHTPSPMHITHLQLDLAEMQHRGMVADKDYIPLHRALIATRDFDRASALARSHPDMDVDAVPAYHEPNALPSGQPTALSINAQNRTMSREPFDLSTPLRIVVVASCHFSRDAAHAIAADAQLQPIFARNAIWLASQNESFGAVSDWNREFPEQPIHVAWQDSEWSMLDNWAMPTFYVFRHGRLLKKFSGWYDMNTLKQSLREAGVLH